MAATKILRLFQVARSTQIPTADLIAYLEERGFDPGRRAMQPVSEEMFLEVLRRFKPDMHSQFLYESELNRGAVRPEPPAPAPAAAPTEEGGEAGGPGEAAEQSVEIKLEDFWLDH